jgi:MFS family permease
VFFGWIMVGVVFLIYFTNVGLPLYGISVIDAGMVKAEAAIVNAAVVGTAVAIRTSAHGIISVLTGILARKIGVKKMMIIGSLLLCGGSLALSQLPLTPVLYIIFHGFVLGAGLAFGGILMSQSLLNDWFSKNKGIAISIAVSAGSVCGILAPPLISELINTGWRNGWMLIAGATAFSTLLALFVIVNRPEDKGLYPDGAKEPPPPPPKAFVGSIKEIFKSRKIYFIMSANLSQLMVYYALGAHQMIFLTQEGGIDRTKAAVCLSIISFVTLISRLIAGTLSGRAFRPKTVMLTANLSNSIGLVILCISQSLPMVYAAAFFLGIGSGTSNIAYPLLISSEFGSERFPPIAGSTYPFNYSMGSLGPLLAGFMAVAFGTYIPGFIGLAVVCTVGGLLLLLIKPVEAEKTPAPAAVAAD